MGGGRDREGHHPRRSCAPQQLPRLVTKSRLTISSPQLVQIIAPFSAGITLEPFYAERKKRQRKTDSDHEDLKRSQGNEEKRKIQVLRTPGECFPLRDLSLSRRTHSLTLDSHDKSSGEEQPQDGGTPPLPRRLRSWHLSSLQPPRPEIPQKLPHSFSRPNICKNSRGGYLHSG